MAERDVVRDQRAEWARQKFRRYPTVTDDSGKVWSLTSHPNYQVVRHMQRDFFDPWDGRDRDVFYSEFTQKVRSGSSEQELAAWLDVESSDWRQRLVERWVHPHRFVVEMSDEIGLRPHPSSRAVRLNLSAPMGPWNVEWRVKGEEPAERWYWRKSGRPAIADIRPFVGERSNCDCTRLQLCAWCQKLIRVGALPDPPWGADEL